MRVDRACFLQTAASYFAERLVKCDPPLLGDCYLPGFLEDLHEYDEELIAELVATTVQIDRVAGVRLRDGMLECISDPTVREMIGWLAAASIAERIEQAN
jgi:hypothetical protein